MKTIEELEVKYAPKKYKEHYDEFVELMESLFNFDNSLLLVVFVGSTPSWNDGDVCRHSSSLAILTTNAMYDGDEIIYRDYIESNEDDIEEPPEIPILIQKVCDIKLLEPISSDIIFTSTVEGIDKRIIRILESQNLPELLYSTNYIVKVFRTKNGIKIEKSDYDLGY